VFEALENNVKRGNTKSCGCYSDKCRVENNTTHGASKTKLYGAWYQMKKRCTWEKHNQWANYGGRGISYCPTWESFENFITDMGTPPSDGKLWTIDRIDVNGNYCKENCKWSTPKEQGSNKRNTIRLTCAGETKTIPEWADITGLSQNCIRKRMGRNWSSEQILTTPKKGDNRAEGTSVEGRYAK